jgi:uncharacterized protein YjbI with pentapeptide repeats
VNLTDANLYEANLTNAELYGATLTSAYLPMANLTGAYLARANLTGASLAGANLAGASLHVADLTNAEDLTDSQIAAALGDSKTKLPAGPARGPDGRPNHAELCVGSLASA